MSRHFEHLDPMEENLDGYIFTKIQNIGTMPIAPEAQSKYDSLFADDGFKETPEKPRLSSEEINKKFNALFD